MAQSGKLTKSSESQIPETRTKLDMLRLEQLLTDFGATGTQLVNGFLEQDYNSDLAGIQGLLKFDKMRKSDAQVNATLMSMELPIRATRWFVQPAKNEEGEVGDEEKEVADFVSKALFEKMSRTWDDTLREILTEFTFGFSIFEKVYTADEEFVWLDKLAFRKQTTIGKWETIEGQAGVTQYLPQPIVGGENDGKTIVSIPANKLLIFPFRREGDKLDGISVLRSAYKHWYIKDNLYKFDNVRHERQSVGVPMITLPKDAGPEDRALAEAILNRIRANEQAGVVLPSDEWKFAFADLQAGNVTDLWKSIEHHNAMISKNILAMFMELASGDGGSRALSEDQSDFFLLSLEAVAKQIDDIISTFLIKELVDLNFDNVQSYPRLAHKKLGRVDYTTLTNSLSGLASSQIITVDDDLEAYVREEMDLPPKMQEEILEEEEVSDVQEVDEEGNPIPPEDAIGEVDEEGNPIEPDEPLLDDEGNPIEEDDDEGTDEEDETADAELADLESQLGDVDADEEELSNEDEDDEDEEEEPEKKPRFFEIEGGLYAFFDGVWYEEEDGGEFTEDGAQGFRVVSEETKRKISEALKKALPNKPVVAPRYKRGQPIPEDIKRKISESLKRVLPGDMDNPKKAPAKGRKMRSLGQRSLTPRSVGQRSAQQIKDKNSPMYQGKKKGGVIANRRNARLKKAGVKKSDAVVKKGISEAINDIGKKPATKTKSAKKAPQAKPKDPNAPTKPKKVSAKKIAKVKSALTGAKTKKQKSIVKAKVTKLRQAINQRKAARMAKRAPTKMHEGDELASAFDEQYQKYSGIVDNKMILRLQAEVVSDSDRAALRRKGYLFNDFEDKAFRPMTFAERKVNFTSLQKAVEKFGKTLAGQTEESVAKMKADLLEQVRKAVDGNDIAAVGKIKAKFTGEIAGALTTVQKEMFEVGKQSASAEMGVKAISTAAEVKGAIRVQNQKLVEAFGNDMEAAASKAVTEIAMKKGGSITSTGTAEAVAAASAAMDKAIGAAKGTMQTLTVIGSLNMGRAAIFERYPEKVYAMQYSAIIDEVTSDICLSLDGRVVKPGSDDFYKYSPPRHYNCRSIWVEILQDEEFKPETGDVPSRIPANATIDTFEDLERPEIKKDSFAIKVLQAELEEREAKVEDYRSSGIFPNRVKQHEDRIDALKKSLKDADSDDFAEITDEDLQKSRGGSTYNFFEHMKEILKADGVTFREPNAN